MYHITAPTIEGHQNGTLPVGTTYVSPNALRPLDHRPRSRNSVVSASMLAATTGSLSFRALDLEGPGGLVSRLITGRGFPRQLARESVQDPAIYAPNPQQTY